MPPVRLAKGRGRDSNLRRNLLGPVLRLRMAKDVPVVENQRFDRHTYGTVSRYDSPAAVQSRRTSIVCGRRERAIQPRDLGPPPGRSVRCSTLRSALYHSRVAEERRLPYKRSYRYEAPDLLGLEVRLPQLSSDRGRRYAKRR